WEECQRIGRLLADEALRIISDAPEQASPKLYCAARSLTLPVDAPLMRALLKALPGSPGGDATSITTQLNLINLGNAQILTIPGEALPNIGYYLKRKMHGENNLLFGLTNDAFGYMLTKEDFNSFERYRPPFGAVFAYCAFLLSTTGQRPAQRCNPKPHRIIRLNRINPVDVAGTFGAGE